MCNLIFILLLLPDIWRSRLQAQGRWSPEPDYGGIKQVFHYKKRETFLSSKKSAAPPFKFFLSANFAFFLFFTFFWVSLNFTKKNHLLTTIPKSVNICEIPLFTKMNTRVFFSEMLFKTLVAFMWCSTTRGGGCGCTWQRKKQWKHSEHVIVKRVI